MGDDHPLLPPVMDTVGVAITVGGLLFSFVWDGYVLKEGLPTSVYGVVMVCTKLVIKHLSGLFPRGQEHPIIASQRADRGGV